MRLPLSRDALHPLAVRTAAALACAVLVGLAGTCTQAQTPAAGGPKKLRVVVLPEKPVPCFGTPYECGTPISNFRLGVLVGEALDAAPGIEIAYSATMATGKALKDPINENELWEKGNRGQPRKDYAIRKAKELDVDGAILVRIQFNAQRVMGDLFFVDARIGQVRSYDFTAYRVGRFDLRKALGDAVAALLKDSGRVGGRESVAVLELEAENTDQGAALAIGESLREELRKTERFSVMESAEMAATFDRLSPNQTVCTAVECALSAGKLLGASKVIAGRVTGLGENSWKVSVIQVDVATGETQASESIRHKGSLGRAGKSLAPVAEDLAVAASPDGLSFRSSQSRWRWKVGMIAGGAAVLGLAGGYLSAQVGESNQRQKDERLKAEQATTSTDYADHVKRLQDEKKTGQSLYNQALGAQVISVGLLTWAVYAYFHPPELAPVAFNVLPLGPDAAPAGFTVSYRW